MKKLFPILILLTIFSGCATTSGKTNTSQVVTGKSLLAIKEVIVNTREAFSIPCQKGLVASIDCQQVDAWYEQSKLAYDVAVDATLIAITSGDSSQLALSQSSLESLANNMLQLAAKYGVKGGE